MQFHPGSRLGPYEILQPVGAGGMGEVYRATHLKLRRQVAIKVLPPELAGDPGRLSRFEREARTASALNHPNIVIIHDIAEHDGTTYIAMEFVDGRTLRELIDDAPLDVDSVIRFGAQLADGLAKAHEAGIIHRDLKPANIMITGEGLVKILDFGLARPVAAPAGGGSMALTDATREGVVVGTPHYMSPEQASGEAAVDHRSDQFALGIVLYEMLAGTLPFDGPSLQSIFSAILVAPPPPLRTRRSAIPPELERLVSRCLEKQAANRFQTSGEIAAAFRRIERNLEHSRHALVARLRRPPVAAAIVALVAAIGIAAAWWRSGAEERWAESKALGEITQLVEEGEVYRAYSTALVAARYRPGDPQLRTVVERITLPLRVTTRPPGAELSVRSYASPEGPWIGLGTTPLDVRIPYAMMRWRITKPGYEPFEGAPLSSGSLGAMARGITLDRKGARPPEMIRVPDVPIGALPPQLAGAEPPASELQSYLLDRYEVTNAEFRSFVVAGGYTQRDWWPEFVREGKALSWDEATRLLRDASGRPGPATWEVGSFAAGEDDHPVGGVSWFEAAAYCARAGKSLPTIYHWTGAVGQDQLSDILTHSNIGRERKARRGEFAGMAAFGSYDMAGNVKEWVWNETGDKRFIMGGSWSEPAYVFRHAHAADPWDRSPAHGVRCARYEQPVDDALLAPIVLQQTYPRPQPISGEAFELLRGLYAYDATAVEPALVSEDDSHPHYRRQTVSIRTAYGDERMNVHLLIPRDVPPPWQSVIWFPGDDVFLIRSGGSFSSAYLFDFIPRGGRVLIHPVYDGMYERFEPMGRSLTERRDRIIRWRQDIGRTIDYLETRGDLDARRIAYYGFSGGAIHGPLFAATEPRLATIILLGGGMLPRDGRAETSPYHFAPRAHVPALMINGEEDFLMPYDMAQKPMFELLGARPEGKRHARLPGGHIPANRLEIAREVLDWLDLQFGPVQARVQQAGEGRGPEKPTTEH
jgi:eukaryotic-like serine/threonine-protein kinase